MVELIAPYYPEGRTGRPPFSLETMLQVHFMQQWLTQSAPAMEKAFFDTPMYREFAQLREFGRLPEKRTTLRFRHPLEKDKLAVAILGVVNDILTEQGLLLRSGTVVDATLIAAPSSTKNKTHEHDPDMHSSKTGEQMYFGMTGHIGAAADAALVHTVRGTPGNLHDVTEGNSFLHGQEKVVFVDAGYQGIEKRLDANSKVTWNVAMRPGKRLALSKDNAADALMEQEEKLRASIRAKVEHPFRVIKRQFGFVKACYRGLKKNAAQLITLFALSGLWMVRHKLMEVQG